MWNGREARVACMVGQSRSCNKIKRWRQENVGGEGLRKILGWRTAECG
jgi:hypothetical protein